MKNLMIDIETLGTRSTSVILSIGAIEFDHTNLGRRFHRRINIDSCLNCGLTVDGSTIEWWMGQDEKAKRIFDERGDDLRTVLLDFAQAFDWTDKLIWCNGMNFDLPIIENAFDKCNLKTPWPYYNGRDYRTVKGMFSKETVNRLRVEPMVAHDALADATAQAMTLQALLAYRDDDREAA